MEKLKLWAKRLDKVFKILSVALKIGAIAALVGLGIVAVGAMFDLPPEMIGTGFTSLELGHLELTVAEEYMPDFSLVLIYMAAELLLVLGFMVLGCYGVRYVRAVLDPMTRGEPFTAAAAEGVRRLAWLSIAGGVAANLAAFGEHAVAFWAYDTAGLLVGEKITHVTVNYTMQLDFLLVTAALFLLHYVFQYGQQLQKLSDETL